MAKRRQKSAGKDRVRLDSLTDWVQKRGGAVLAAVLLVYVVFSALLFDPKPFVGGDNAAYVALSGSLVQGRGLTEIWTPQQQPHTQYPFGFPLMLAPISILKLPYVWYKIVPWLAGLAGILLSWHAFRKHGFWLTAATCLLLAINPQYLEYSHWVLSELPFLAAVMLSLWALERWEISGKWQWFLGSILAVAAGIHIRNAGVALLAAVPLYLAYCRKFRWALIYLASGIALMIPWSLRNSHYGISGGYIEQFLLRDPYQPELGMAGLTELASRIGQNLWLYLSSVWPKLLFPIEESLGLGQAGLTLLLLLSIPVLLGSLLSLLKADAGGWLVLSYLGLSIMWPVVWTDLRFALPILPLIIFSLLGGYGWILERLFKGKGTILAAILLAILVLASIVPVLTKVGPSLAMKVEYHRGDRLAGYDPQWRSFFQAADWTRDNTPEGSIVVSRKPQLFYLESNRRSFCYPFTTDADSLLKTLSHADYVMVEPVFTGTAQRYLIPAIEPWLNKKFKLIHTVGDPPTYVLQVLKEEGHGQ